MLFTVEGGGFFSASAAGYTKGLALLLLGKRNEERSMKVSPWNQHQSAEQELNHSKQLASRTDACGRCASFACFCYPSTSLHGTMPPKLAHINHPKALLDPSFVTEKDGNSSARDNDYENRKNKFLKSSLKKPPVNISSTEDTQGTHDEAEGSIPVNAGRRKVQWTDACGRELTETREFEMSDEDMSEEEFSHACNRRCGCTIQ